MLDDEYRDKLFNLAEMIAKKLMELLDMQIEQSKRWSNPIKLNVDKLVKD